MKARIARTAGMVLVLLALDYLLLLGIGLLLTKVLQGRRAGSTAEDEHQHRPRRQPHQRR